MLLLLQLEIINDKSEHRIEVVRHHTLNGLTPGRKQNQKEMLNGKNKFFQVWLLREHGKDGGGLKEGKKIICGENVCEC